MNKFKYIPLDNIFESCYDWFFNSGREKKVFINGEEWTYYYFSGKLHEIKQVQSTYDKKTDREYIYIKKIPFISNFQIPRLDRKEVSYCQIINKYFGNGIYHHGIQKKYKIDEYGNNTGDIYEENWVHGKKHGICTYHGYRKEFWSNGIKYKTELYENDKLVEVKEHGEEEKTWYDYCGICVTNEHDEKEHDEEY